jgi:hypothetical protein
MHVHTHISIVTKFHNIEVHIHVHTHMSVETNLIISKSAQQNMWLPNKSLIYILSTRELETQVKYLVY